MIREGHSVTSLQRPLANRAKGSGLESNLAILETPLEKNDMVRKALTNADLIIYCAGTVKGLKLQDFEEANVSSLENVMNVALGVMKTPRIIYVSSLAASQPHLSAYSESKRRGESVLRNSTGLDWIILRPTAVYGRGDKELLPLLKLMKLGIGLSLGPLGQRLTFIHVDDCVRAITALSNNFDACKGQTFTCHDGKVGGYTWDEIWQSSRGRKPWVHLPIPLFVLRLLSRINMLGARIFRYAPMLTSGKVNEIRHDRWVCDNSDIVSRTSWKPSKDLREGVKDST